MLILWCVYLCMQGLSSRIDEPSLCTVHFLKTLHDMFHFFYKSADSVLRVS